MLNFLQNWPVRGSGSSFLSHLSGSDSFCNGIINRAVSFSFLLAARAKNAAISGGDPVLVWLLGTPASGVVGAPAQQGGERDAKDWDLPLQRTEHCLACDPGCWNHTTVPHSASLEPSCPYATKPSPYFAAILSQHLGALCH